MQTKPRTTLYILLTVTLMLAAFAGGLYLPNFVTPEARAQNNRDYDFGLLYEVRDLLEENFVDKISKKQKSEMVYDSVRGMLRAMDDEYTRFMDPKAYKNMTIETKGKFGGVGILIGIRKNQLTVISPLDDTPAFKAGIKGGDIIIKIDGVTTEDMALDDAVARIRGDEGTTVVLTIWRRGFDAKGQDFPVVRDIIKLKTVTKGEILDDNIAYVEMDSFSQPTTDNLRKQLLDFNQKNAEALILDLRNNPGGLLDTAVQVSNLFIDEGPIVHRVGRNKDSRTYYANSGRRVWFKPVVVLVNEFSASASEIVSGALQDHGVATIIGETTFGKGLVQTVYPLSDNSAVLITTDKYLTAKRRDINKKGIVPDIVVKLGAADAHEGEDVEAMAPDKIGKFPIGEPKKGDGGIIFNGLPRSDVPFYNFNGKKYIEADDLAALFGVVMDYDKETNTLDIEQNLEDLQGEEGDDPQLDKAVEFLKSKIAATASAGE